MSLRSTGVAYFGFPFLRFRGHVREDLPKSSVRYETTGKPKYAMANRIWKLATISGKTVTISTLLSVEIFYLRPSYGEKTGFQLSSFFKNNLRFSSSDGSRCQGPSGKDDRFQDTKNNSKSVVGEESGCFELENISHTHFRF